MVMGEVDIGPFEISVVGHEFDVLELDSELDVELEYITGVEVDPELLNVDVDLDVAWFSVDNDSVVVSYGDDVADAGCVTGE